MVRLKAGEMERKVGGWGRVGWGMGGRRGTVSKLRVPTQAHWQLEIITLARAKACTKAKRSP